VRIRTLSLFYDVWLGKLPISELERISLLFDINEIHRPAYARSKRALDVAVALVGMLALAFAVPVVAILNLFGNRRSSLLQPAPRGQGRLRFHDSQVPDDAPRGSSSEWTTVDDPRLGKVGRMLRQLHIDELPQMWNVFRHDLSIVGPTA